MGKITRDQRRYMEDRLREIVASNVWELTDKHTIKAKSFHREQFWQFVDEGRIPKPTQEHLEEFTRENLSFYYLAVVIMGQTWVEGAYPRESVLPEPWVTAVAELRELEQRVMDQVMLGGDGMKALQEAAEGVQKILSNITE
jgi:hypothetical protein